MIIQYQESVFYAPCCPNQMVGQRRHEPRCK